MSDVADRVPRLQQLAASAAVREWPRSLRGLPPTLAKPLWRELKRAEGDGGLSCKAMYPFVRDGLLDVTQLDLTDADRWLTDVSLGALAFATTLRSVRLTACPFITDGGLGFCGAVPLTTLDVSWTAVGDAGVASGISRCPSLTSLNLTGCAITDAAVSSLLPLASLARLSLASTRITDAALDYLSYYTRYPDAGPAHLGVHGLQWLELSSTKITDAGVGKLTAIIEDGTPYGKVFKQLSYLALSMTTLVTPSAVQRVKAKYEFDTPLPNKQRTLAASNYVALEADKWVIRHRPSKERELGKATPSWGEGRMLGYVAAYTKEMGAAAEVCAMLDAAGGGRVGGGAAHETATRRRLG